MMPWNAYGVWWSRYWAYNESGIRDVVEGYEAHNLPLNYLVLDVDWHKKLSETTGCCKPGLGIPTICENPSYEAGYGGYSWDRQLFSDPTEFTRWLHDERNLSLLLNLHDAYGEDHCQRSYAQVARAAGVDPATNRTLACNFENKELQIALHHFELESGENAGVDAWWTDYGNWNSPLFSNPGWQCELDAAPFGQGTRDFSSPASLWSSYVRTSRLVQKGKRPFRLGIYGGIGSHRYPLVGSGDTIASWPTLGYEVFMTITGANVATAWTHDLGGFVNCEDETC
jgi:alpha-glucosidase (family GH31 glycosyl hydrolase)